MDAVSDACADDIDVTILRAQMQRAMHVLVAQMGVANGHDLPKDKDQRTFGRVVRAPCL